MKNPELEYLIAKYDLTTQKVADLLEVPKRTVDNWRRSEDSAHSNFMSKANLKLLRLLLKNDQDRREIIDAMSEAAPVDRLLKSGFKVTVMDNAKERES